MATIDGWKRNGMLSCVRKLRTIAIGKSSDAPLSRARSASLVNHRGAR